MKSQETTARLENILKKVKDETEVKKYIEENILKQGKDLKSVTLDEMNALWEDSKKYD